MSKRYKIFAEADSAEELVEAIAELQSILKDKTSTKTVASVSLASVKDDGEEYEEVPSPYGSAPTSSNQEVDVEGLPWDERIHSNGRTKVKNGTWKVKKGLDENVLYQVRQELKARYSQPLTQTIPAVVPQAPVTPALPTNVTPITPAPVQAPVVAPPIPTFSAGHTLDSFKNNFAMVVGTLITQGKLTQEYVNQLKAYWGVGEIWQASDAHKAECFDLFTQAGFVQRVG